MLENIIILWLYDFRNKIRDYSLGGESRIYLNLSIYGICFLLFFLGGNMRFLELFNCWYKVFVYFFKNVIFDYKVYDSIKFLKYYIIYLI